MNVGDMKYTYTNREGKEESVVIPKEAIKKGKLNGLSVKDACQQYMYEQGLIDNKPAEGAKKTRTRKPNPVKRKLINELADLLADTYGSASIVNEERIVQVEIDGSVYEFTLVQKRKPKQQ